jgi:hypothetical protein
VARDPEPYQDGTVTYYAMMSAVGFGDDLRQRAISALRKAWECGHWHSRFGLPDAFNDDISQADLMVEPGTDNSILLTSGPWLNRALFAIDQGPMLLHLENARSGLIWKLLAANPNIRRALTRLSPTIEIALEAEEGSGDGDMKSRSEASGDRTVWLQHGESHTLTFQSLGSARYAIVVRYSNDNFGPLETVGISVDGANIGQFSAQDTGDFGAGWKMFESSGPVGTVDLEPGTHELAIVVSGGDGYGVEIDMVTLERAD